MIEASQAEAEQLNHHRRRLFRSSRKSSRYFQKMVWDGDSGPELSFIFAIRCLFATGKVTLSFPANSHTVGTLCFREVCIAAAAR
jgi:hypothetical protein